MKEFQFIPHSNDVSDAVANQLVRAAKQHTVDLKDTYAVELLAKKMAAEFYKHILNDIEKKVTMSREVRISAENGNGIHQIG